MSYININPPPRSQIVQSHIKQPTIIEEPADNRINYDPATNDMPTSEKVTAAKWSRSKIAASVAGSRTISHLGTFFNPQPENVNQRTIQMLGIIFFALLSFCGIVVQVYTDVEQSTTRQIEGTQLMKDFATVYDIFDIALLVLSEMEPSYEYNNGAYDIYLQKAQAVTKEVDSKLIFNDNWPTDLSAVPADGRQNISSANAMKLAIQAQRLSRKAINGTKEADVILFYGTLIDNLVITIKTLVLNAVRFPGWREFLAILHSLQSFLNLRKYSLVCGKLARENRTVDEVSDPVYETIVDYFMRYSEFLEIATIDSPLVEELARNLSDQQSTKDVERWNAFVYLLDFSTLDGMQFGIDTNKHADDFNWILIVLRQKVTTMMRQYASQWNSLDIFSIAIYIVASTLAAGGIIAHIVGTRRMQLQITSYHQNLTILNEAFSILYDCIPASFVKTAMSRELRSIRQLDDACVMIMDISNIHLAYAILDATQMLEYMELFFETIEATLRKYNCFKIEVHGDTLALGAGFGETHAVDHCVEMVFAALEIRDIIQEINLEGDEDLAFNLRIGLSVGPCYSRIVYLQVPRMAVIGPVIQLASIVHATCLPQKVQVAEPIYTRLAGASEFEFVKRGPIEFGDGVTNENSYWALWADETRYDDGNDVVSIASSSFARSKSSSHPSKAKRQ